LSTAIRFDHVSKRFTLHHQRPRSFQDLVIQFFKGNGDISERPCVEEAAGQQRHEEFWALRDVSFEVEHGETVGIIGPNGAGKSTVLKLVSRIIEPTSGEIEVDGRIGALLELGAGFHPDLSGRENIYMNGSILGLSRDEIECKLDEIITFAELERFIDMPVKHYSSGMRMRLGFSIAAHIDPEILLIDEVLAVGDQNFQHKCLEHIVDMQRHQVTICFVSHGLGSVRRLCSRAIWLSNGAVLADGAVDDVVSSYLRHAAEEEESRLLDAGPFRSTPITDEEREDSEQESDEPTTVELVGISFLDKTGKERRVFRVGEPWVVQLDYRAPRRVEAPVFSLAADRNDGVHIFTVSSNLDGLGCSYIEGEGKVLYAVDPFPLMEGMYLLSAAIHDKANTVTYDRLDRPYAFRVRQVGSGEQYGLMSLGGRWEWDGEEPDQTSAPTLGTTSGQDGIGCGTERRWGTEEVAIADVAFLDAAGVRRRVFETGEPWVVRLHYRAPQRIEKPVFGLAIHRQGNLHICGPNTYFSGLDIPFIEGAGCVYYRVDQLPLTAGTYHVSVSAHDLADTVMYDYQDRLHVFKVCEFDEAEDSGVVNLSGEWTWGDSEETTFT